MAKQTINVGSTGDDKSGDTLRSGAIKINNNFSELYNDLTRVIDKFQPGSHITLTKTAGVCTINAEVVPYTLVAANTGNLGGVRIPAVDVSGITNTAGIIGLATASTTQKGGVLVPAVGTSGLTNSSGTIGLATASTTQLGGIRIPLVATSGIINNSGTIGLASASTTQLGGVIVPAVATSGLTNSSGTIGLATASFSQLGGIKIGSGFLFEDGMLSALPSAGVPAATTTIIGGVIVPVVATSGIINDSGTIGLASASTTQLGGVIVPAVATSGITNNSGTIGLATASQSQLGGVKIDNSTITINGSGVISSVATYTLLATTTTTLGGVIIPAVATSGITNASGTIGLAIASSTQLGGVKVDNSTIIIDQVTGVISSTGGGGGSGLTSRTVAAVTSASLAAATSGTYTITGFKGYAILSVQTSAAAWVTIYSSVSAQAADASRTKTTDPVPGSGVIAEVITTSSVTQYFSPAVVGYSSESTPTTNIPIKIYNNGSSAATITVTLTLIKLEA